MYCCCCCCMESMGSLGPRGPSGLEEPFELPLYGERLPSRPSCTPTDNKASPFDAGSPSRYPPWWMGGGMLCSSAATIVAGRLARLLGAKRLVLRGSPLPMLSTRRNDLDPLFLDGFRRTWDPFWYSYEPSCDMNIDLRYVPGPTLSIRLRLMADWSPED